MAIFAVWRNLMKPFSERDRKADRESPAMRLGITDHLWTVEEVLAKRRFPSRVALSESWADYYWGRVPSRGTCQRL